MTFPNTTFVSQQTVITAAWLQAVNNMSNRHSMVIDSVAALRLLTKTIDPYVTTAGYYTAGDGGGGTYFYDSTDTTSTDNNGTVIVATDGGRWKLLWSGQLNVKHFGAKGDNSNDDSTAIQAAIDYLEATTGGTVYLPTGDYVVNSRINITWPNVVDLNSVQRVTLKGDGTGFTRILDHRANVTSSIDYASPDATIQINFTGHTVGHINGGSFWVNNKFGGFSIISVTNPGCGSGIYLNTVAYIHIEDVVIESFKYGIYGSNFLSSSISNSQLTGNAFNIFFELNETYVPPNYTSNPNSILIDNVAVSWGSSNGIYIARGTNVTIRNCAIEANGTMGNVNTAAILYAGAPQEGGIGLNVRDCYFENNAYQADVFITQTDYWGYGVTHNITGCNFDRVLDSQYTIYNVFTNVPIPIAGTNGDGVHSEKITVNVIGCGFQGYAGYTPNASHKYIGVTGAGATTNYTYQGNYEGNFYASATELPVVWTPVFGGVGFLNSWVNIGAGGYSDAAFYKDSAGVVHLQGTIKSGTIGASAFLLPVGYRPPASVLVPVVSNGVLGTCTILANGNVGASTGSNLSFTLDGITFQTY
ncbi:Pectate lyase superfamily protein [uncultured Caudovirales phage]|uniref:Pectate lyase superfamily protein n=1 Tax=uncultured Caudovirales phage TaxID=2100421 RepID=A0A6J5SNR8_9CAUD|nr:Pectate lyase superfamily protein [uncultured Caudovirales phage]